jgi:tetratricopeptide (TPR) repeat protein
MLRRLYPATICLALLLLVPGARAGLYYSGESFADLPSQWRGFLLDQRTLRNIALQPVPGGRPNAARARYEEEAARLEKKGRAKLTADELADLGAVYVRVGEVGKAVDVLRDAQRAHPSHFRIVANLGTAWQLQGDLEQAATCLEQAVRLAPGKLQKAEEYQLKLVRLRRAEGPGQQDLDDLFGSRYQGPGGKYAVGKIDEAERKKLPADAAAVLQQLALFLPADGRLLWQLAELANATGDVRTAASIMDGCVSDFGMRHPQLRAHRQLVRAEADEQGRQAAAAGPDARATHEGHVGGMKPRSRRPLVVKFEDDALPPIDPKGVNPLPWSVLGQTTLDKKYRPTFVKYLQELNGKQVSLEGYVQPLGEDLDLTSFMLIENPVGCWYCEMPDVTGIVLVELPAGQTKTCTRGRVKVAGTLKLNSNDPENFLYTVAGAKVTDAD